jgi:ectoine hydroxylase-related dioxygenase (phytanoyl-CoA dioxygenase family)
MKRNETLTDEQITRYRADGYVVVPDLLTDAEIDAFLNYPPSDATGLFRHYIDANYRALATHPKVTGGARQLLGGTPCVVQTMFLDKPARGGQGIALHQDSHYLPNEPSTLMACWLALSDTGPENGGLCAVPGSHREGLWSVHRTQNTKDHVSWETQHLMRDREGREWEQTLFSFEIDDLDPERIVRLTVPRGGGVFFTGMTIHGSFANNSPDRPRRAFAVHFIHEDTWLFRADVQNVMRIE